MKKPVLRTATFAATETDGLNLVGYAAVFNERTVINDWDGQYDEMVAPGAFKKTLRERTPVLQFDHGFHPVLGSIPIGSIDNLSEDERGLYVEATLHDNWMTEPVRDAIASGSISGMSFRFGVIRDDWQRNGGKALDLRTIREVALYELGPVVFPAYEQTAVGLRSSDPTRAQEARMLALANDQELLRRWRSEAAPDTSEAAPVSETTQTEAVNQEPPGSKLTARERRLIAARIRMGENPNGKAG